MLSSTENPVSSGEITRLQALDEYAVFDTPPEEDLDRLIDLTARMFATPLAALSLVGHDRLFFKSRVGMQAPGLDRAGSFCAHAIESNGLFLVTDASKDARFARHPLVTEAPGIRFYAGVPLVGPGGQKIGTLCILDVKPWAEFTDIDRKNLEDVAALVMNRLERRRLDRAEDANTARCTAHIDTLTGLPNRAILCDRLRGAIEAEAGTVLLLDLDGFKDINDTLGHSVGDLLLRAAADRIRAHTGSGGTVARLGGDEFAIVLPDLSDTSQAAAIGDELVQAFDVPFASDAQSIHLSISIGIATYPHHGTDAEELLANADLALHRAKAEGGSGYQFYAPSLRQAVIARRACEAELRRALSEGQFELFYQPQVRLADRSVIGAEALLRWRHPDRGLLAPAAFLSVLESGPLAASVGDWVLTAACAAAAAWRRMGIADFRVGVNLFEAQFRGGDLTASVERALMDNGLPADALELEITENIMLRHDDEIAIPLREMRAWGVGIAFDDYGTGYASLSLLKRYPLTRLKIDQAFVRTMCVDREDAAIIQAIMYLGRRFDLGVVAEGIETEAQETALRMYGCTEGQGYFYSEPVPAAQLTSFIDQEQAKTTVA